MAIHAGICVCLLGVEALIITLVPVKRMERAPAKLAAVVVCFVLAAGEIWMVKLDREETFAQHERDMQAIFARFVSLKRDILALQANATPTLEARVLPSDSLKRRALDLSNEILHFLISRAVPPGYGQGGYGEGPYGGKP